MGMHARSVMAGVVGGRKFIYTFTVDATVGIIEEAKIHQLIEGELKFAVALNAFSEERRRTVAISLPCHRSGREPDRCAA
jgi:hypothetical protein